MAVIRGNLLVISRDYIDQSTTTISGEGWNTSGASQYANLQNTELTHVLQSTGRDTKLYIDFGRARPLSAIAIPAHNFSPSANWRIRFGNDAKLINGSPSLATTLYDNEQVIGSVAGQNSPVEITLGTVNVRVPKNNYFNPGVGVRLTATDNTYIQGDVISFDSITKLLSINVTEKSGSGTKHFWTLYTLAGSVSIWPEVEPHGSQPWGEYDFAGQDSENDPPPGIALMPYDMEPVRYGLIEIEDDGGPGYQEIGKLIAGFGYQPLVNFSYGYGISHIDNSQKQRTRGGQVHIDAVESHREFQFSLDYLTEREFMTHIEPVMANHGVKKPMFMSLKPESGRFLSKYSIYGSLMSLDAGNSNYQNNFTQSFQIEEHH